LIYELDFLTNHRKKKEKRRKKKEERRKKKEERKQKKEERRKKINYAGVLAITLSIKP
jgi:histone-lysine N-methyltransferase SUV420H